MRLVTHLASILDEVRHRAEVNGKLTGFCIGNTRKINESGMYFSPIRDTNRLVAGSVIVYSEDEAREIANRVDGQVDYVLIDAEKKATSDLWGGSTISNVERVVRETVKQSKILTYKGNDLTVDAIETFVSQVLSSYPRGLAGKTASIIGAGNVGSKLALKLVERGMSVTLYRRDTAKLSAIVTAINLIKPPETIAEVTAAPDCLIAAKGVDLLIGLTHGIPVITPAMVNLLAATAVILDGGKGCIEIAAIKRANCLGHSVYRADIRPGFSGHLELALETERIVKDNLGRAVFNGVRVVSSGLMADVDEVVVDSITNPSAVYGVANGAGDFVRTLSPSQLRRLSSVREKITNKR